MNLPQFLTIKEASHALKIHPNTFRNWEKEGLIIPYLVNGKRFKRYKKEDILSLLKRGTKKNQAFQEKGEQTQLLHYKSIIESSNDAIIGKTLSGIITSWNPGAEHIYGYTSEEMIGKSTTILYPSDSKDEFKKIARRIKKGERIKPYRTVRVRKNGTRIDISSVVSPIKNEEGTIVGISTIARDITEEKRTEDNIKFLSESSKILSSSLDYAQTFQSIAKLAVHSIAEWSIIDIVNDKGELEFVGGWHNDPKKYKVGMEFHTKFPINKNDSVGAGKAFRLGKSLIYTGKAYQNALIEHAKNKKLLEYYLRKLELKSAIYVPLRIQDRVIGVICFISSRNIKTFTKNDVFFAEELANRAALAIENARLYQEAQEAISVRDDFISMASHELKTPLTSIKLYTQTLQKDFAQKGDTTTYQKITKIDCQLNNLAKLINELLDLSKMHEGKLLYHKEKFAIDTLITNIVELMQQTTERQTITIHGKTQKIVYGDQDRIGQVLINFISNAIKYSQQSDKIIVSSKVNKKNIIISVQDLGIGIEKKYQQRIFERFYQVTDSVEKSFPGLGIGLYISAEIIKKHKGNIWVESEKGKGSTFSFSLPLDISKNPEKIY